MIQFVSFKMAGIKDIEQVSLTFRRCDIRFAGRSPIQKGNELKSPYCKKIIFANPANINPTQTPQYYK